jgi:hypothetical protein
MNSHSNEQDRRSGDLLSEVMRRLCVVRSVGDPQAAASIKLPMKKRIGIRALYPVVKYVTITAPCANL